MKPLEFNKNHAVVGRLKGFCEENGNNSRSATYRSDADLEEELGKDGILKHAFYFRFPKKDFSRRNNKFLKKAERDLEKLDKSLKDIYKKGELM